MASYCVLFMKIDLEKEQQAAKLRGSLLEFCKFFFTYMTKRDFIESNPIGRESHQKIICRELTKITRLETKNQRLIINIPPGHAKSTFVCMWISWCFTHYADCNFLYISYSHDLAAKHTSFIRSIMSSPLYKYLFNIEIKQDSRAKDHFETTAGGAVAAFGSSGAITGRDAGLPGLDRFSGAVVIDDPLKPDDAHSDTIRGTVKQNYEETIRQRVRGHNVPIIFIGQRLHEDDLAAYLLNNNDIRHWDSVILKALDEANNVLDPEIILKEELLNMQEKSPYVFSSQYQQDPLPPGGGLFKKDWFSILDEEPAIIQTFITADTAETDKSYNDATVFSFWGLYEIENFGEKSGVIGLHWLDCAEIRIEPKDLQEAFIDFWQGCLRHKVPPKIAAIEKKSTGTTLVSVLQNELRGIQIRDINRSIASKSKTDRFIKIQTFISNKQISFTKDAHHVENCINHMSKITANNTHRFDDIADTCADAIKIALIDKSLYNIVNSNTKERDIVKDLNSSLMRKINVRNRGYG